MEAPREPMADGRAAGRLEAELAELRTRLADEVRRRRDLEKRLIAATETEQRRISLELHDGLGQHLSGLAYTARSLAARLAEQRHAEADEAAWLARLLRDAVGRIRALSRGLWPVSLERQSLASALAALARDIEQVYGVTVNVHVDGFVAESGHAAHHLFRIAQEAIHNAIKHAQARRIDVRVEQVPPRAMLSIVSDGAALDPQRARTTEGLGLLGMRLRAEALDGEFSIEPLAAGGTEVCVTWPLRAEAAMHPVTESTPE